MLPYLRGYLGIATLGFLNQGASIVEMLCLPCLHSTLTTLLHPFGCTWIFLSPLEFLGYFLPSFLGFGRRKTLGLFSVSTRYFKLRFKGLVTNACKLFGKIALRILGDLLVVLGFQKFDAVFTQPRARALPSPLPGMPQRSRGRCRGRARRTHWHGPTPRQPRRYLRA